MLFNFVLSLHIFVVLCAIGLAGALHAAEILMRRASSVAELRVLAKPGKFGPAFGVIVLALFGLGSWLVSLSPSDEKFHMKDPFIWTAIVVLVFLFVTGPAVNGRHHTKLDKAIEAAPEGPISGELRTLALDPTAAIFGYVNTMIAIAVVFNMANKPSTAISIIVILGGAVVGTALGWLTSRPVAATAAVGAPAAD